MLGGTARSSVPPTFQGTGASNGDVGDLLFVTWPTHVAGDIGLLGVETANQPVATPVGWSPVTNGSQGTGVAGDVAATCMQVFWRRALSAAEGNAIVLDGGDHQVARMITFRGCLASGDPIHVSAGNVEPSATTAVSIPGATTTVPNTMVVAFVSYATDGANALSGAANASLTGVTAGTVTSTTSGNGGGLMSVRGVKATAGAYAATTGTLASATVQGRVSLALLPA